VLSCVLFLSASLVVARAGGGEEPETATTLKLTLLLIGAGFLRIFLAAVTKGYEADIATFSAWAGHAAHGLGSFYSPGYFADYPPGYIYVLWLIGTLQKALGIDFGSPEFLILLKLPAICADCATTVLLFTYARRSWGSTASLLLAGLYAFNPAVIFDSAVWGQVDSVLTLPILLGVLLLEKSPAGAGAAFATALLIKPQALIFAPLPLLWFAIRFLRREQHTSADLLKFTGSGLALFCLVILPFSVGESPLWIIRKYGSTLASYPYATLNAYNLFALSGGNAAPVGDPFLFLTYGVWGNIGIVLAVLFATVVMLRGREFSRFWYSPLFLSATVFIMTAKMHERYLFPALALSLGLFIATRSRPVLVIFAGFSVTQFLNVAQVLTYSHSNIFGVPRLDPLLLSVSFANVALWMLLAWIGYRRYVSPRQRQLPSHSCKAL